MSTTHPAPTRTSQFRAATDAVFSLLRGPAFTDPAVRRALGQCAIRLQSHWAAEVPASDPLRSVMVESGVATITAEVSR